MNWNLFRSPALRNAVQALFNTTTGHDHDGVNSKSLSPAAVVGDGSVTNVKLANDAVGTSKILNNAVTTAKILNANVTADKLAADAVVESKIADDAVSTDKLVDDAVTNDKLANIARGSVKVGGASNAPTDLNAKTNGQILVGDGTDVKSVAVSGDVTLANTGAVTIGAGKVTTAMLAAVASPTAKTIADPGDTEAIPVTGNGNVALTIADAAETNTLAVPTFAGQIITISADTVAGSGSRAVTVASAINADDEDTITFDAAGEFISLYGIKLGASFAWRVLASDGVTLS